MGNTSGGQCYHWVHRVLEYVNTFLVYILDFTSMQSNSVHATPCDHYRTSLQDHISRYPKAVALSCKATVGSKFSSSWAESTPISLHPQNSVAVALAPPANIAARCIILLMYLLLELVFIPLSLIPLSLTVSVITKMTAPASAQDASNMIKVCSLDS